MSNENSKALILRPAHGLQPGSGGEKVLARVVADALALARAREIKVAPALIRVGNFEFREEDYRQIVIWADEIGKSPIELIALFEKHGRDYYEQHKTESFVVEECRIKRVMFPRWGIFKFDDYFDNALIRSSPKLSQLEVFACQRNDLNDLDLSSVPALTNLDCSSNKLASLDLSNVPVLNELNCFHNNLTTLDLSHGPRLARLHCSYNNMTRLDLSPVPALEHLDCEGNALTELDVSVVPLLKYLDCGENELKELDLSNLSALKELRCKQNNIRELDVRGLPQLRILSCDPSVSIIKHDWQSFNDED